MNKGWWRRNLVGLLLIPPLVAGVLAFSAKGAYTANYGSRPMEPVALDGTGRAVLDDYASRLVEVKAMETDEELATVAPFGGTKPPRTVKVWRAMVTMEAAPDTFVTLCNAWLEDEQGRRYSHGPTELGGDVKTFSICGPDDDEQPMPYTVTFHFVLPADARPAALLITWDARLPRFIQFPIP